MDCSGHILSGLTVTHWLSKTFAITPAEVPMILCSSVRIYSGALLNFRGAGPVLHHRAQIKLSQLDSMSRHRAHNRNVGSRLGAPVRCEWRDTDRLDLLADIVIFDEVMRDYNVI